MAEQKEERERREGWEEGESNVERLLLSTEKKRRVDASSVTPLAASPASPSALSLSPHLLGERETAHSETQVGARRMQIEGLFYA